MKEKIKNQKGITLVALAITIIVLLILAGISISILRGNNSIIDQATKAKNVTQIAQIKDQLMENWYEFEKEKSGEIYTDSQTIAGQFQEKLRNTTEDKSATVTYNGENNIAYNVTFRSCNLVIYKDGRVEAIE